jgi:hypothetical protein
VKTKRSYASPAENLYVSPMFKGRRAWVEQTCSCWFVLSALHGLVDPKTVLEPYDVTLVGAPNNEKRAWSRQVLNSLDVEVGHGTGLTFEIHAGAEYRNFGLVQGLLDRGAHVEIPMEHLSQGEQLEQYGNGPGSARQRHPKSRASDTPPSALSDDTGDNGPRSPNVAADWLWHRGKYAGLSVYLTALESHSRTVSFSDFERIIGFRLPRLARDHRPWWANDVSHSQAQAWLSVGWETRNVELVAATVTFVRVRRV